VAAHVTAFVRGMSAAGVASSAKHFPGLGRVRANTDLVAHVVDPTTRAGDPFLQPFRAAVGAGVPFVMMSSAYYPRIDRRHPAVFSPTVIGLLRHGLGFGGVVVSDSLDTPAVSRWTPAQRATWFLRCGGDMVLLSSPAQFPLMYAAVLKLAERDPAFAALVDASALRVLTAKQRQGLL
jgi:beta-N-acetylhexosaminidase